MKNKAKLALFCTVLLSVSLLAGCGAGSRSASDSGAASIPSAGSSDSEETDEIINTDESDPETEPPADGEMEIPADDEGSEDEDPLSIGTEDAVKEGKDENETKVSASAEPAVNCVNTDELLTGKHHAKIEIRDYGTIELELDADVAPISVTNFVKLAQADFYDGLTFHRIIDGFMMQGGDPNGNGTGGSEENIKGEFEANGVENSISHVRGTISMARAQAMDSASSRFFIVHKDSTFLDGRYAAFGTVTDGMEVVDEICKEAVPIDSNGSIDAAQQPVIETIDILD